MPVSGKYKPEKHLQFLGLSHNPFPMAPDNTDLFLSRHSDTVVTRLTEAILSRKGFMLLTGEIGLGKTTLSRRVIEVLEEEGVETALILQSFYQGEELLKEIVRDFGIPLDRENLSLPELMQLLNEFFLEKSRDNINCAVLIDDAQNLSVESLELIRMISNLEADREKLVQILLVGQPELLEKLNTHALRQLKSRITEVQNPVPLEKKEMEKYLQFKLTMAGDSGKIVIKAAALNRLYRLTRGNIRKINVLMDHALSRACEEYSFTIHTRYINKAFNHLNLQGAATRMPFKRVAWTGLVILIIALVGALAGTGLFYLLPSNRTLEPVIAAVKSSPDQGPEKALVIKKAVPERAPVQTPPAPSEASVEKKGRAGDARTSAAIVSFLKAYDLAPLAPAMEQAMKDKRTRDVAGQILERTGLQLIRLSRLTESIRQRYDILTGPGEPPDTHFYYLFWNPLPKIDKFYFGYRGPEISRLQQLLARYGLYTYHIDGIVGQILTKSVKEFQRQMNLEATGFPDPETVFLMANGNGQAKKIAGTGKKETDNE